MTRDSRWWWIGMLLPVLVEAGTAIVANPTDYGIPLAAIPPIRLVALLVGLVSGKLATSPLLSANEKIMQTIDKEIDMRKITVFLLASGLLCGAATLPACAHGTPRHDTVVSLQVTVAGLGTVQDTERALFAAGKIAPAAHQAFSGKLAVALKLTDDAVVVVQAWRPGQPVPAQLTAAIGAIRPALQDALNLVNDDALTRRVLQVYDALVQLLALMGGAQ